MTAATTAYRAEAGALASVLDDDKGAAFQLCRKLDPGQLQALALACGELERICRGVFYLEYGGPILAKGPNLRKDSGRTDP
jgi:hypothetical protein